MQMKVFPSRGDGCEKSWYSNMSNKKNLGYIADYTTQLFRDYNEPLQSSILNKQYNMESKRAFFAAHMNYAYT